MMRREVLAVRPDDDRADVPQIRDLCPRPASLAGTIVCARSATCNLVKTFDT